jgi:hypothetical protein
MTPRLLMSLEEIAARAKQPTALPALPQAENQGKKLFA